MPARKKTSDRVSSIAARVLSADDLPGRAVIMYRGDRVLLTVADLRALAASCLSQDETPRKVAKRGKR